MKIHTALWLVPLLTLCFAARSDKGNIPSSSGDYQLMSPTARRLATENVMLRAKLEQVQDALDDATDKIEAAQHLLSIEGEPAALEYATSQLDDALSALEDASDAADPHASTDYLTEVSSPATACARTHRSMPRGSSKIVRGQDSAQRSHGHGIPTDLALSNHEHT